MKSVEGAGIGPDGNVYAELGSTWFLMLRRPEEAAHVLGKLLVALGPERIVWGTDSIWYGTPQPLIDAFRAFEIPERMQAEYGYPPLTRAAKARILGTNARELYDVDDATADAVDDGRDQRVGRERGARAGRRDRAQVRRQRGGPAGRDPTTCGQRPSASGLGICRVATRRCFGRGRRSTPARPRSRARRPA